jgi:hypothetical protein
MPLMTVAQSIGNTLLFHPVARTDDKEYHLVSPVSPFVNTDAVFLGPELRFQPSKERYLAFPATV